VKNPNGVQKGVASVTLDGRPIEGNVLPVLPAGTVAQVVVTMG
jgi:cellobiose phosphorylase